MSETRRDNTSNTQINQNKEKVKVLYVCDRILTCEAQAEPNLVTYTGSEIDSLVPDGAVWRHSLSVPS